MITISLHLKIKLEGLYIHDIEFSYQNNGYLSIYLGLR